MMQIPQADEWAICMAVLAMAAGVQLNFILAFIMKLLLRKVRDGSGKAVQKRSAK